MINQDIESDWHRYERESQWQDAYYSNRVELWLLGVELWLLGVESCDIQAERTARAAHDLIELEGDSYQPKPARDIRAEKTRDYRKRKPKAPKVNPVFAVRACVFLTLFGGTP